MFWFTITSIRDVMQDSSEHKLYMAYRV